MTTDESQVYEVAGGEIAVWAEPSGAIILQVRNNYKDPVDMGEEEALELAELLIRLVKEQRE
ncbi:hypothetical protein [Dongia deserti]|uniref:hypothetical protein n=1 Tax=Dongia deserti TaxID=2268030 RepID=UPI000E65DD8B|nr:hypothetical protein [Dongia deserti]